MRREEQEQFLRFVTERTPELFGIAYDLAGRQDAAERLLQRALERLAPRWRRERDPFGFTVAAMRRRSLPWWRRWSGARGTGPLPEPSGRGRPVDLGDLALAGARHRRWARTGVAATAVVLVGAVAVVPGQLGVFDEREGEGGISDDLSGMSVVTAFYRDGWHLLNPDTGEYERRLHEPGSVSPDLRTTARLAGDTLVLESTTDGGGMVQANLPFTVSGQIAWSPDGAEVVLAPFAVGSGPSGQFFRRVAVVEVSSGTARVVELDFPEGYGGWWGLGAFWTVEGHLAVPTIDGFAPEVPPQPGLENAVGVPLIQSLTVFDRDGAVVAELPLQTEHLDDGEGHAGLVWLPARQLPDGRFLLYRRPGPAVVELAASDLSSADQPYVPVGLDLASQRAIEGQDATLSAWPAGVLSDGRVLVDASFSVEGALAQPIVTSRQILVFDLAAGSAADCGLPCDTAGVAAMLGVELPVPDGAEHLSFGDATALTPAAGRAAF